MDEEADSTFGKSLECFTIGTAKASERIRTAEFAPV